MGKAFWTTEEKQFFLDKILPRSIKAEPNNDTGENLRWEQLVPVMQKGMKESCRTYTANSLFQHWYQKIGPRAKARGEADSMTMVSRERNHAVEEGQKRKYKEESYHEDVEDEDMDEEYELDPIEGGDDERTSSPDLPSFPQFINLKGNFKQLSKSGRLHMFVEDTDSEDDIPDRISELRGTAHYHPFFRPSSGHAAHKTLGQDYMDDENDIPGKEEDERCEEERRHKKTRRNGTKTDSMGSSIKERKTKVVMK